MPIEFINELMELIVKHGEVEHQGDVIGYKCGDFRYIEDNSVKEGFMHLMYKEETIFSQ